MGCFKTMLKMLKENKNEIPDAIVNKLNRGGLLNWMPDKAFLKLKYRTAFHEKLDLKNPKTFNAKLQWLKLYDRKPEYAMMVDKYAVRENIAKCVGEEYLIPLLGRWNSTDEIDIDTLPEQFVLKCSHDSGSVVICRDKACFDWEKARKKLDQHMHKSLFWYAREWPYKNVKPCIIAEEYMCDEDQKNGLVDYKFYCFNGEPKLLYVSQGLEDHSTARISFLQLDWSFAPFKREDFKPFDKLPPKPENYERMLEIARKLSQDMLFLRVDMYEINRKLYFSELTFTPSAGWMPFDPPEWDAIMGSWLVLKS